jgi:hypothetical protein
MDDAINNLVNSIISFFTYDMPMFLGPYILYSYVLIQKYLDKTKNQLYITSSAIRDSFYNEYLGFIKTSSDNYFPFLINSNTKYSCDPKWIYNPTTNVFTYSEIGLHSTNHNIPFIGASVAFGNQTIGDLSDWIMDQKVHAPDAAIPLQILVSAWRYYYDKTLMFSFKDYTLTVVTEDGDEHTYNLENEEELVIQDNSSHSTPSVTDESEDVRNTVTSEDEIVTSKKGN